MESLKEASSLEAVGTVLCIVGSCCALERNDRSKMKSMVKEFLKEFIASLVLFVIFYIGCTSIAISSLPNVVNWVYHAACVIMLDRVTNGASMNPAVSTGLWVNGTFNSTKLILHLTAQVFAGQYGFYVLKLLANLISEDLFDSIQGPNYSGLVNGAAIPLLNIPLSRLIHNDMVSAFVVELVSMFILCFVIYYIEGRVQSALTKVAIVALTLRVNMFFTEDLTGANMNPMVAYSWLFHVSEGTNSILGAYYQKEYIMVYCIAPMVGGALAALVVSLFPGSDSGSATLYPKNTANTGVGRKDKAPEEEVEVPKSSRASSRGRSRTRKTEPEPEPEPEPGSDDGEEEEQKPVQKKASRSRSKSSKKGTDSKSKSKSRSKSQAKAKAKAKSTSISPAPSPAPKRRTSSRRR
jgi:glycerol uptake facilitator-like aquaporin